MEQETESKHRGSGDQLDASDSGAATETSPASSRPSTATGSGGHSWWKWALLPGVILLLLPVVGGPVLSGFDAFRDFFRSPRGEDVDDLKEALPARSYWVGDGPRLLDGSFAYLVEHDDDDVVTVEDGRAGFLSVERLLREAPVWEGKPVLLVGKVIDRVVRAGSDEPLDEPVAGVELTVSGADPSSVVIVGLDPDAPRLEEPRTGETIVFRGVPTAVGRVRFGNNTILESVHFVSQGEVSGDAVTESGLRRLVRRTQRAGG